MARLRDPAPYAIGLHALVVEDNVVVMMDLEDTLLMMGFAGVHTATSHRKAFDIMSLSKLDVAILDFELEHTTSLAVADELSRRNIPFIFMSGYGPGITLPERHRHVPVCAKPFSIDTLSALLTGLVSKPEGGA